MDENTSRREEPSASVATPHRGWLVLFFWGGVLLGLFLIQEVNFLLFHSLAEIFSIIIAGGVFIVAWVSRERMDSDFLLVIGIGYAFVAILDLIHTLAYAETGVFPAYGADLPTQLWIAARYLESVSIVLATTFIGTNWVTTRISFSHRLQDTLLLVLAYAGVAARFFLTIFEASFQLPTSRARASRHSKSSVNTS